MVKIPKFPQVPQGFHAELKRQVQQYFETTGKSSTGDYRLFTKAILIVVLFALVYVHLVFFTPGPIVAIAECLLLGGLTAAIGFNIMHDGGHGSFSKYKFINRIAAASLNILGGSSFMWNIKHNIIHHAFTNVDGVDDDIDIQPWMRMSETQPFLKMHRYQHRYFWFLYAMLYILWIFYLDFNKYFSGRIGAMPLKKMSFYDHFTFWGAKVLHAVVFIALPIYQVGFVAWVIGFSIFALFAGFVISIVFQLAHTVEHTHFPVADVDTNRLENEWAVHQIMTTANFATDNKLVNWLVGGLNFQIEHHLFPKISHVHYAQISKIVKATCEKYQLTYIEFPKVRSAVKSHVSFLRSMGRPSNA